MSFDKRPLWSVCTVNDEVLPDSTPQNYEFDYVDISSVTTGIISTDLVTMNFGDAPSRARRLTREGDVIVSTVRTYLRSHCARRSLRSGACVFDWFCCAPT